MNLKSLHSELKNAVGDNIACAIRLDWIVNILSEQVKKSNTGNYSFKTIDPIINCGLDFDLRQFQLVIKDGEITMQGFTVELLIKDNNKKLFNRIPIRYKEMAVEICIINNRPKLLPKEKDSTKWEVPIIDKPVPDQNTLDSNGISIEQYLMKQEAILFQEPYIQLLDLFFESVTIPNALPAMSLIKLQPPYNYFNIDDKSATPYMVVTGQATLNLDEDCKCRNSSIQRNEAPSINGTKAKVDINGTTMTYPGPPEINNVENPAAVFYIPKSSFSVVTDTILKPAVSAHDEGYFLLLKWYWEAVASIEGLNMEIDPALSKIVVKSSHRISGRAGIALKIICIYQRILEAHLEGYIDNGKIELGLSMDHANNVMMHADYSFKLDVDLDFLIGFDLIFNAVLDSVLDNMVKGDYEKRLNLFNNNFLNLNLISPTPKFGWRMSKNFEKDSVCIGVIENKG